MADKFEQKHIDDATPAELRLYATKFLGIPIEASTSDAEVASKVALANDGDHIWIEPEVVTDQTGSPPPPVEREKSQLVGGLGRNDPKVRLTLHAEERDGVIVNRHKEVGVNGVVWLVKRGESVEIPYRVFLALNDAVRDAITHDAEGTQHHMLVHSVPFSVERMPSPEEIEAFHERTRDTFCPA